MKGKIMLLALLLSMFWVGVRAQSPRPCDLMVMPEGDNLCILERRSNDFSVVRACRGNTVAYRAYSPTALSYSWSVTGGTIASANADSTQCWVTWGEGEGGLVTVTVLRQDSSFCTSYIQVVLLDKPVVGMISSPNYVVDPGNPEEKWLEVCAGDTLTFTDNSTAGEVPIVDYYWELEWDHRVSNSRSFTVIPLDPGTYSLIHRVYNECGCYDEEKINIIVNEECPLKLSCFGAVCGGGRATYTVFSPTFHEYFWTVDGGSLEDPIDRETITVQWESPASGYGTLTLSGLDSDCPCKSRKSIRIPIISDNVPISGPDTICVYDQYEFTLPLWGSTEYHWSASPSTNIYLNEHGNIVRLSAMQPGIYTLKVTFECKFLNCGPYEVYKTIVVKNPLNITASEEQVCVETPVIFTTNASTVSRWTVMKDNHTVHSAMGVTLNYTFHESGIYSIYAQNNNYCNRASVVVNVHENPPALSYVEGPDTICPHYTAAYSATPTSPNYYIRWKWNNDNGEQTYSGNKVNITFGSTVSDVRAIQVDRITGCESDEFVYHVHPFQLAPWPYTTPIKFCRGQKKILSSLRDQSEQGVTYDWVVVPSNAIAIQGSDMEAEVTLLANYTNNNISTAKIILKRVSCSGVFYDSVIALIGQIDAPEIRYDETICMGRAARFTISNTGDANASACYWWIDNNSGNKKYGLPVWLTFSDTQPHVVHLHYVTQGGCDVETTTTITADTCPSNPGGGGNSGCERVEGAFAVLTHCYNTISVENLLSGTGLEYPFVIRVSKDGHEFYHTTIDSASERVLIPETGNCTVTVTWRSGNVCYYYSVNVTLNGPLPNFSFGNDCAGNLVVKAPFNTSVRVRDLSGMMPDKTGVCRFDSLLISLPASGWYNVRLTFRGFDCYLDSLIYFNQSAPVINSIHLVSTMCEKTSYVFSANATGDGLTYRWDFGDQSYNFGNGVKHVYDQSNSFLFVDPLRRTVTLTVTDRYGCSASVTRRVNVYKDDTSPYNVSATSIPVCPGPALELTATPGAAVYNWNPTSALPAAANMAYYYQSGTYGVEIVTNKDCHKKLTLNVPYPNGPFASIYCDSFYCQFDNARLYGSIGEAFTYHWDLYSVNGHHTSSEGNPVFYLTDTGWYQAILIVSDGTCEKRDTSWFYVHPQPQAPALTLCGNPCITEGPVDVCSALGQILIWSNGARGTSTQYYMDGYVSAYYVDPVTGCKSSESHIYIPEAPDFSGFLSGCYRFCKEEVPDEMFVYSLGENWHTLSLEWYRFSDFIHNTTLPPSPANLPVPDEGEYQLVVPDYGMGCKAVSPLLTIETVDCGEGDETGVVHRPSINFMDIKVDCDHKECELFYNIFFTVCNNTDETIKIDNIASTSSQIISSFMPFELDPGQCTSLAVCISYEYFSATNTTILFYDPDYRWLGSLFVDFSDWLECLHPGHCDIPLDFWFEPIINEVNQSIFFKFILGTFPSSVDNVLSVWCDQGQFYYPNYTGPTYDGLLLLDYGLTSQLTASDMDFCFHILLCIKGEFCVVDVCIPYGKIWESAHTGEPIGDIPEGDRRDGATIQMEQTQTFILQPNPATDIVDVRDAENNAPVDGIVSIEVISMQGKKVLSVEGMSQFDVSNLPTGAYIVRVVTDTDNYEYLKLIKK